MLAQIPVRHLHLLAYRTHMSLVSKLSHLECREYYIIKCLLRQHGLFGRLETVIYWMPVSDLGSKMSIKAAI